MAWNAQRNQIYHERCKNVAVAMQNLAEEAARLRTIFVQQLQDPPVEYTDTDVASVSEINTYQSYLTELLVFHNGGSELSNVARGTAWALPLVDSTPA